MLLQSLKIAGIKNSLRLSSDIINKYIEYTILESTVFSKYFSISTNKSFMGMAS